MNLRIAIAMTLLPALSFGAELVETDELDEMKKQLWDFQIVSNCGGLAHETEKIRCINNINEKFGVKSETVLVGEWITWSTIDPMTDEKTALIFVNDLEDDEIQMSVRCMRGVTDLYVKWPSGKSMPARSKPVEIRTRVDKESPATSEWRMANESRNVTFYNDDVVEYVSSMLDSKTLVVEVLPGTGSGLLSFQTDEMRIAITSVREACNW